VAPKEQAMATSDKPVEVSRVSCEVCLKEVPVSEAKVVEAVDSCRSLGSEK
jgi:hypothetical protein